MLAYLKAKEAPEVDNIVKPESLFFWQAFHHLRRSRQIGMALGPIPISEILGYAEHAGMTDPVSRTRLLRMMAVLDSADREAKQDGNT